MSVSYKVRLAALLALQKKANQPKAPATITQALIHDPHYIVRAAAALSVGRLAHLDAIGPLLTCAANDDAPFTRQICIDTLHGFSRAQALPAVLAAFAGDNANIRHQVIAYLAHDLPPAAEFVVMRALGDAPKVSTAAINLLLHLPPARAMDLLHKATSHHHPAVRVGAMEALKTFPSEEAATLARDVYVRQVEVDEVRMACRRALKALRDYLPLADLVAAATKSDRAARASALRVLGIVGGARAEATLLESLDDRDVYLRGAAVLALRDVGQAAYIPSLEALTADPANARIVHLVHHAVKSLRERTTAAP